MYSKRELSEYGELIELARSLIKHKYVDDMVDLIDELPIAGVTEKVLKQVMVGVDEVISLQHSCGVKNTDPWTRDQAIRILEALLQAKDVIKIKL